MATIAFESAEIIDSGATLRLTFAAGSWSTPTIDLSSVVLKITRDDTPLLDGIIDKRSVVEDSTTVLGGGELQIDCHCTGNDGTTDSTRNPMHDGMSAVTISCDAGIGAEGSDTTAALVDQAVTLTSLAAGPVFEPVTDMPPALTYNPRVRATAAPSGSLAIKSQATTVPRPGTIIAAADVSSLTITGITNIYKDLHWEWALTQTDGSALPAMSSASVYDPKYDQTLDLYTDIRGGQFRAPVNFDGTVRLTLTGKYLDDDDVVQEITATQDYTVREIEWANDIWVDSVNGDSGYDGLAPIPLSVTDATYNPATRELTSSGAFSGYDHAAAIAPSEPHKRSNFTYMTAGTFTPSAGTPNDHLTHDSLVAVGAGTNVMDAWANSGSDADWTGTGIDILNASVFTPSGAGFAVQNTSPDISRASTSNPTSMTIGLAFVNGSSNTRTLLAQSGVFSIRQVSNRMWVDIQHGGGTQSFDTGVDIGGSNGRKMVFVRFTEGGSNGTLTVRVNGVTALDEVSTTATALLASANNMDFQTGGVHHNVEMVLYESAITDAQIEEWEGYWGWSSSFSDASWQALMPVGHTYENAGPVYIGPLEIESKTDSDTVVLASGYTLGATSGIELSTGPKDDVPSLTGSARVRIAGGSQLTNLGGNRTTNFSANAYGSGRYFVRDWTDAEVETGVKFPASGVFTVDHYFVEDAYFENVSIGFGAAGNTGAGSSISSCGLWNCVDILREQTLLCGTGYPDGVNSFTSGIVFGKCVFLAAGTLNTKQAFTENGEKDGSGDDTQADFGTSFIGLFAENNSANDVLDHIIYSAGIADNRLFALIQVGQAGDSNYALNIDGSENDGVTAIPSRQITVWGCELANTLRGIDLSSQQNTPIEDGGDDNPFAAVQILDNSGHDLAAQFALYYICDDVRFFGNHTWRVLDDHYDNGDEDCDIIIHGNYALKETGEAGSIVQVQATLGDSQGSLTLFDNYFQDDRTAADILRAPNSSSGVFDIENNQVYAPNDSDGEWLYDLDAAGFQSVAEFETATSLSDTFTASGTFGWSGQPSSVMAMPTIVTTTPADNATGILASQTLGIEFSENMAYADGSALIEVYQSGMQVASARVDDGNINALDRTQYSHSGLLVGLSGAVSIRVSASAFVSQATGLPFAGIADDTTWNFTIGAIASTGGNRSRVRDGQRLR